MRRKQLDRLTVRKKKILENNIRRKKFRRVRRHKNKPIMWGYNLVADGWARGHKFPHFHTHIPNAQRYITAAAS